MSGQQYLRGNRDRSQRVLWGAAIVGFFFLILAARLWYLQVIDSDRLKELSEINRLRFVPVAASRGNILDRNGKVLVRNTPSFSVAIVPQEVKDKDTLLSALSRYLGLDRDELLQRWEKGKGRAKYFPIVIASGISRDQLEFLEENQLWLPGIDIEMKPIREYPSGILAAHLLGYLGEITEQDLEKEEFSEYNQGDYVGKNGLERSWEKFLHGINGGRQIEVDARGRYLRTLSETRPTVGNSLVLTIDHAVQQAAEKAFGDRAGAAVVMEVDTGEILAFVSSPGFDPSLFAGKMPQDVWKSYLEDKRHPLENKALKGQYPPGSTFKIITALAGLESGMIDEHTTVTCKGSYDVGKDTFKCWDKKGHGTVDLKRALRESCDVYFYQLSEKVGVDRIAEMARRFGLGSALGVGLENEKSGLIPTTEWKEKKYGKKWFRGETLPVSIGQGYTLMTPIQLASMTAALANEGTVYRPHLVKRVVDPDGRVLKEYKPEVLYRPAVKPQNFRLVKEGLLAVVNEPHGTGGAARLYEVKVAGKTGTSQVVKQRDAKMREVAYQYRDHALFVAFAPFEKPEVAVSVVIEHGEHGGAAAAPIAGTILRAYFEQKGVIKKPAAKVDESDEAEDAADRDEQKEGDR
ncbi:penicillin-binding protein 2 [Geobacter sp. OR-1]|uniref:penicillin-binding protein 2 n=1 Tax=Geobacter sp. OR-1 TaxID=1266765 RepID=UPI000542E9FD|nr:penicillin-binding protein 2 [Geobacter sp. OR-1]GAM08168.1 penicillin-binding protein 2 [Geobacter sp. OR-1]